MYDPMLFPVPTSFDTARLLLRTLTGDDAPALYGVLVDSIDDLRTQLWAIPWIAEEPTLESSRVRCQNAEAAFLLRTDHACLVFERSTQRLVASMGLHRTDWALNELGAKRVELVTDTLDVGARAVAERCGFELEGIMRNVTQAPDGVLRHQCVYARLPVAA